MKSQRKKDLSFKIIYFSRKISLEEKLETDKRKERISSDYRNMCWNGIFLTTADLTVRQRIGDYR